MFFTLVLSFACVRTNTPPKPKPNHKQKVEGNAVTSTAQSRSETLLSWIGIAQIVSLAPAPLKMRQKYPTNDAKETAKMQLDYRTRGKNNVGRGLPQLVTSLGEKHLYTLFFADYSLSKGGRGNGVQKNGGVLGARLARYLHTPHKKIIPLVLSFFTISSIPQIIALSAADG